MSEPTGISNSNSISFGPFRLIPAQQQLLEADKPVHLGSRALAILVALTERAGEVVSKDELITRVWPNTFVEEGNLRVHIAALRRALGDGEAGNRYVANIPGRGYRFVAPVLREEEPHALASRAGGMRNRSLPLPLTQMVGRAEIVAALARHLAERRFITIVGPGGIGKTTVALAVAHALSGSYADGIRFIDLAPLADPLLVPSAVASVLGLAIASDNAMPGLVGFLADKQMLLVLDSCEHVVEAAAVLAVGLLRGAPEVRILAASREPLRAEGERVHRLAPLGLPPVSAALTAAEALGFPAVQLFSERATAVLDGFELSDADAPIVAEICYRLDGIPLAIELAAGRVDAFGIRGVAARLDDRFRLLTRGQRTALPRHQTLSAALDWSYDLLPEAERQVLRSLGVFAGAFALEGASAMAADSEMAVPDVADIIANLVAKSLVTADVESGVPAYRLLNTTRAYALGKLSQSGERERVARRHAEYYRRLLQRAEAEWETRPAAEWLAMYGGHADNVRVALDWAFSPDGDASMGVALTAASVPLWTHLSHMEEGRQRIERALAALASGTKAEPRRHMQLLSALAAALLLTRGVDTRMTAAWTHALDIAEGLDDADYRLRALWGLYVDRITAGHYRDALALAKRFRAMAAHSPDPAESLIGGRMMGTAFHILGDQSAAREHVGRMLSHYVPPVGRSHFIRFQFDQRVVTRTYYSRILWLQGFADQAMRAVGETIADARGIDHPTSLFYALVQAACPVALLAADLAAAERFVQMLLDFAVRHAMDSWGVWARAFRGVLLIKRGEPASGLPLLRTALAGLPERAFNINYTMFLAEAAAALARLGDPGKGLATIDEALARSEYSEERWCVAELLRIKGELLLAKKAPDAVLAADECFEDSLDWARRQGALSWELRTSIGRARLWREQGRIAEARELLASVYDRFSEGFATTDLKAAQGLLHELA